MTIAEVISLAANVGTMFAAILAFFTLFELFKQRKSSYKPDLCILQKQFDITGNRYDCGDLLLDWVDNNKEENSSFHRPSFGLVNVGLGVAKKVQGRWSFDTKKFIFEINELSKELSEPFFVKKEKSSYSISSKEKDIYRVHNISESFEFEYILPIKNHNESQEIGLSLSYTLLVSAYLSLCIVKERSLDQIKIPPVDLFLKFKDIGGATFSSKHKFECQIILFSQQAHKPGYKNPMFSVRYSEI